MPTRAEVLLERALTAEQNVEHLQHEIALLKASIAGALDMDVTTAVQALAYISRCEAAEALVSEAITIMDQWNGPDTFAKRSTWRTRATAVLKAAQVQQAGVQLDRPPEERWTTQFLEARGSLREIMQAKQAKARGRG